MTIVEGARDQGKPLSVALIGNAAEIYRELVIREVTPDVVTDQTPAHDPLAYVPHELSLEDAIRLRSEAPHEYIERSAASMAEQVNAMLAFKDRGAIVFDYGNNLRQRAYDAGVEQAFLYPGFVPAYIRPLFCEGKGPFRWVALSGDPEDIFRTDDPIRELFPDDQHLHRWLENEFSFKDCRQGYAGLASASGRWLD